MATTLLTYREALSVSTTTAAGLYLALFIGYASLRWWKILTKEQSAGFGRFNSKITVPFFIASVYITTFNPYYINVRLIGAEILSKIVLLVVLGLWAKYFKSGSIDMVISIFTLVALPNSTFVGIPFLSALFGSICYHNIMPILLLRSLLWSNIILALHEIRLNRLKLIGVKQDTVLDKVPSDEACTAARKGCSESFTGGSFLFENQTHQQLNSGSRTQSNTGERPSSLYMGSHESLKLYSSQNGHRMPGFLPSHTATPTNSSNAPVLTADFYKQGAPSVHLQSPTIDQVPVSSAVTIDTLYPVVSDTGCSNIEYTDSRSHMHQPQSEHILSKMASADMLSTGSQFLNESTNKNHHALVRGKPDQRRSSFLASDPVLGMATISDSKRTDSTNADVVEICFDRQPPISAESSQQLPLDGKALAKHIAKKVLKNIAFNAKLQVGIWGLTYSLIASRYGYTTPPIIDKLISVISRSTIGMSMVALGFFMAGNTSPISGGIRKCGFGMVVRFVVAPLITLAACIPLGVRGEILCFAISQAALPIDKKSFIFAKDYQIHIKFFIHAIITQTLMFFPIGMAYYYLSHYIVSIS